MRPIVAHQLGFLRKTIGATIIGMGTAALICSSASAGVVQPETSSQIQIALKRPVMDVVVVRRGRAVVGPRGGVVAGRTTVVRPGYRPVRPGYRPVRPVGLVRPWVRPARYWWPVGGAIAAGAAVGFVTAATAAAWAGPAPAPGYCWYYTDSSRKNGFWDSCPR